MQKSNLLALVSLFSKKKWVSRTAHHFMCLIHPVWGTKGCAVIISKWTTGSEQRIPPFHPVVYCHIQIATNWEYSIASIAKSLQPQLSRDHKMALCLLLICAEVCIVGPTRNGPSCRWSKMGTFEPTKGMLNRWGNTMIMGDGLHYDK